MEIEITPELLADLKDKAKKIKFDTWHVLRSNNSTGWGHCVVGDTLLEVIAKIKGNGTVIKKEYIGPRKMTLRNAEYIAAANPAVILALIAKIEELQTDNQYLNDWAEIDKEESFKHIEFVNDLKALLGIDDDIPCKIVCPIILQKIKELIGEKSNDQKEKGQ